VSKTAKKSSSPSPDGPAPASFLPLPETWRQWADVSQLFAGPADPDWDSDSDEIVHNFRDPWAGA
jgi:hypothetical protein